MLVPKVGWFLGLASLSLLACSKSQDAAKTESTATSQSAVPTGPVASAAASVGSSTVKRPHPARSKLTCAELIPATIAIGKQLKMPVEITPGSWGKVPKPVQVLPPDGTLCGSVDLMDQAMIITKLDGQELESFYAPLFAKADCGPLTCEDYWDDRKVQVRCTCRGEGFLGSLTTDTTNEAITVGIIEAKFVHKNKK
jgi:hypothetical protein